METWEVERQKVLLINPPYFTLTSVKGVGHQVPLGLLMVGGALLAEGVAVELLDAECLRLSDEVIIEEVKRRGATVVMTGHAGSTPAHPTCARMLGAIKRACPEVVTVYGGVYPTYHAREILRDEAGVDVIVRGEGEATAAELVRALGEGRPLQEVAGLAVREEGGAVVLTGERAAIVMDDYKIGWELLDREKLWDRYQCFGLGRAVIVQFSRGCPHQCSYCGQRGFWVKWRHRDAVKLADEIEWLARERGVRFVTLADENPTTLQEVWRTFLQEMARRNVPVKFFATIRATDIVRDRAFVREYAAAGIQYVLLGIDTTDAQTLKAIRKGSTRRVDQDACGLLREAGVYAMIGHIVGFGNERWSDFLRAAQQLAIYDGDYLNAMYAMPHAWTQFAAESRERVVIETELRNWDYRHQLLAQERMGPWEFFAAVKLLELVFHLRPKRIWRLLTASAFSRQQFFWGLRHIGAVWVWEIISFCRGGKTRRGKRTVGEWYGLSGVGEQRHKERLTTLGVRRERAMV